MTKEVLEKEATEFEENYTVYEVAKRKDGSDYAKKVCKVTVKEAYIAGAEPREKRIDELERKLEQTEKDLTDYQFNYPKIKDLEKENAELQETVIKMNNVITKTFGNLTKAKELLKQFLKAKNGEDTYKAEWEAEQFLKDCDIDNAIQQANKGLDFDKIADEMKQDLKDSEVEK